MNYRVIVGVLTVVTLGIMGSGNAFNFFSITDNGNKVEKEVDIEEGNVSIVNGNTSVEITEDEVIINATSGNAVNVDSKVVITGQKPRKVKYEESEEPEAGPEPGGYEVSENDFPEDLPQYPGSQVEQFIGQPGNLVIELQSKDATQKINSFYKKVLRRNGWKTTFFSKSDTDYMMICEKGKDSVQINLSQDDDYSEINIITSHSQEQ